MTAKRCGDVPTEDLARYVAKTTSRWSAVRVGPGTPGRPRRRHHAVRDADRGRGTGSSRAAASRSTAGRPTPRTRLAGMSLVEARPGRTFDRERGRLNRPPSRRRGPGRVPGQELSTPPTGLANEDSVLTAPAWSAIYREPAERHVNRRQDRPAPQLLDHIARSASRMWTRRSVWSRSSGAGRSCRRLTCPSAGSRSSPTTRAR